MITYRHEETVKSQTEKENYMSNLIVMLTKKDVTVPDALEIFESCRDMPVTYWGIQDHGLVPAAMKQFVDVLKAAGKIACLEAVSFTEEACMRSAQLAVECDFDYLFGTLYYDAVFEYLKVSGKRYCPYVGNITGNPRILRGTVKEMLEQERIISEKRIFGTDLSGYRYKGGNKLKLCETYIKNAQNPVCLSGGIDSDEKIKAVKKMDPWAFTIGTALFTRKFRQNGDFRENLEHVIELM